MRQADCSSYPKSSALKQAPLATQFGAAYTEHYRHTGFLIPNFNKAKSLLLNRLEEAGEVGLTQAAHLAAPGSGTHHAKDGPPDGHIL
jgi:hypothetical protein